MSRLKQTAFRLNAADEKILAAAKKTLGLTTRTEALRFVLRQWAEQNDFKITKHEKRKT